MLAAALLFSTGGAAVKACTLSGWQVACFRSGIAAVALVLLLPATRRGWTRRTAFVALAYAATLILYVLANKLTTASNAIFLQSTAPLYLLALAPWWLGEAIRRHDLAFMAALAGGMALFFVGREAAQATAPDPWTGNLLAIASAFTWALTVGGLRWLAREDPAERGQRALAATLLGNVFVFAAALPFALPMAMPSSNDMLWLLFLGVIQIGLAYVFLTRGMRRIRALEGALLLLVEPVLNTLWAWWLHDEVPALWARVGALLILVATAIHAVVAARTSPAEGVAKSALREGDGA